MSCYSEPTSTERPESTPRSPASDSRLWSRREGDTAAGLLLLVVGLVATVSPVAAAVALVALGVATVTGRRLLAAVTEATGRGGG